MIGRSLNTHEHVDHINHNGLDNRRSNLRLSTPRENLQNQLIQKRTKTSKFKGVSWYKDGSKWRAYIYINYKQIHLGFFGDETEAARAYDQAASRLFKEYCNPNFDRI